MAGQDHVRKGTGHTDDEVDQAPSAQESTDAQSRDDDVDALLDEIDDVLETNAEEFVAAFVQKGGQ